MDWRHKNIDEPHLYFLIKSYVVLLKKLNLKIKKQAYYGITHKLLLSPYRQFLKRLRGFFWRNGITYYHPEKNIYDLVKNDIETQALLSFDAHKEQSEHSWWLRNLRKIDYVILSHFKYIKSKRILYITQLSTK